MEQKIHRRNFIRRTALAAGAVVAAPYILPSGRLFAATGNRIANHVVFCLFAGGVRNIESVKQERGNLLPGLLNGSPNVDPLIAAGLDPLPAIPGASLQSMGTLYREFRYAQGPTGHFNGHSTAITGNYTLFDLNIKESPRMPTVFEYYRKHTDPQRNVNNAWWISNTLGPYPSLNFSSHGQYGPLYGANYMQPASMFTLNGVRGLANPRQFNQQEAEVVQDLQRFFNSSFSAKQQAAYDAVVNENPEKSLLQEFIKSELNQAASGAYINPWNLSPNVMNGDMYNIFFAERIIREFQPELLVVNMQGVDICHSNYTEYCNNLRKADYAVQKLWECIQSTPGMANDTILIVAPEHGRNLEPNTITDSFGQLAIDHTSDPTSREIFCLIAGPAGKVKQNQVITQVTGESIDIVPTIASILGFKDEIPGGMLPGRVLSEAFV